MKVCVTVGFPGDPDVEAAAFAHVRENWGSCQALPSTADLPAGAEALLVVGQEPKGDLDSVLIVERVPRTSSKEETLFQMDAKLGKLTHSDLVKTRVSLVSNPDKKVSRRDLLSFRMGLRAYSDAPFVFADRCDAKYRCKKCVEVCPATSLCISDGAVLVDEKACVRCGLCAENCPTSAIQMPKLSEDAFLGLLDGLNMSDAPKKTLVLTCDASALRPEAWMCVEEVNDVGLLGPRHIALAGSSSLGAFVVYCADGKCEGREKARTAIHLMRNISKEGGTFLSYAEGPAGLSEVSTAHALSRPPKEPLDSVGKTWPIYSNSLLAISRKGATASGLRLTLLQVSDTCTLCGVCARKCPHLSLRLSPGSLIFDPLTCTGCGHCISVCPERSITMGNLLALPGLRRTTVTQDEIVKCAGCGMPLESAKLLKKVASMVGREDPMLKYCPSCKQILAFQGLTKRAHSGKPK